MRFQSIFQTSEPSEIFRAWRMPSSVETKNSIVANSRGGDGGSVGGEIEPPLVLRPSTLSQTTEPLPTLMQRK